jgi:hypothetical protein
VFYDAGVIFWKLSRPRTTTVIDVFLLAAGLALCLSAWQLTRVTLVHSSFRSEGTTTWARTLRNPIALPRGENRTEVLAEIVLGPIHPLMFQFRPDDCMEELRVNDLVVENANLPYCNHLQERSILLVGKLWPGSNTLHMLIRNHAGPSSVAFSVPWYDPVRLALLGTGLALIGLALYRMQRQSDRIRARDTRIAMAAVVTGGIIIRLVYLSVTDFLARGHDVWGHIEYTQYMAQYWSLPLAQDGWQFYHPPLYYMLTGVWYAIGISFGRPETLLYRDLQVISFVLATATFLLAALWIGKLLFPRKENAQRRALFAMILAVFPSFVFFAARLNNDVLLLFLLTLMIGELLRWWQGGGIRMMEWVLCITFLSLAILTKSNALLLAPIPFVCLAALRGIPWRRKAALALLGISIILLLTGWHTVRRFAMEKHTSVVANITNLNESLRVDDTFESITTFSPLRILREPYNDPFDPRSDRDWFWEYLMKSAFFGEFYFGSGLHSLSTLLLLCSLLLLPVIGIGVWQGTKRFPMRDLPMLLVLGFSLIGHMLYRETAPFSSSQDFRYSIVVILPCAYFLLTGLAQMPRALQRVWLGITYAWIILSTAFLLGIGPT